MTCKSFVEFVILPITCTRQGYTEHQAGFGQFVDDNAIVDT
jgi:hypothetical protein